MSRSHWVMLFCATALLLGCGGGGGKGKKKPQPAASVQLAVTSAPFAGDIAKGDVFTPTVSGTWTAANLGTSQVYLQVTDSGSVFAVPPITLAPASGTFSFQVSVPSTVVYGSYSGALSVRACADAQCAQPYTGAAQSVGYSLKVNQPDVKLTVTMPPITAAIVGDEVTLGGTWTGAYLGRSQVYLQVSDNAGTFVTPPVVQAPADNSFGFTLVVSAVGDRSGFLTVRACEDIQCIQPYANSTQTLPYTVKVQPVPEWETLQGNAAHNGYVPVRFDPAKFAKSWEWTTPNVTYRSIHPVVTTGGKVFVADASNRQLYALSETNGAMLWMQSFTGNALNPPATSGGTVYITTTGHSSTYLWAFNAADGKPLIQSRFDTQWAYILAPTVKDGRAFVNSGYYGGVVYAFDGSNGTPLWNASGGTYGQNTPAVDDNFVYSHNGQALGVHRLTDGMVVASIGSNTSYYGIQSDYYGAPMLGSPDNVIAYLGDMWVMYGGRYLQNYSVANQSIRWKSAKTYKTYPAVAKGVIYVASDNPKSLDAIDEATGQVLWSWVPGTQDTSFQRNVVVTDNLVFVSTNRAVYALDLATHSPVWESATPGALSISGNRMLYIATGVSSSDGRLLAFRLR